jgi:hypothetical protein
MATMQLMASDTRAGRRPGIIGDTVSEALGRTRRDDPVAPKSGGPAGNARLTAWIGLVLLVLSLAELVTVLDVQGLISWHIVIGTLLVPPAVLKTVSTGWRVVRYYRHHPAYRQAGPPPLILRVLGPGVVASTLGLLASGLILILLGPDRSRSAFVAGLDWVTLHQALFLIWGVLTGLHVLARIVPALRLTVVRSASPRAVDGGNQRVIAVIATLATAAVAAAIVLAGSGTWRADERNRHDFRHGGRPPGALSARAVPGSSG